MLQQKFLQKWRWCAALTGQRLTVLGSSSLLKHSKVPWWGNISQKIHRKRFLITQQLHWITLWESFLHETASEKLKSELLLLKPWHSQFSFHRSCFVNRSIHLWSSHCTLEGHGELAKWGRDLSLERVQTRFAVCSSEKGKFRAKYQQGSNKAPCNSQVSVGRKIRRPRKDVWNCRERLSTTVAYNSTAWGVFSRGKYQEKGMPCGSVEFICLCWTCCHPGIFQDAQPNVHDIGLDIPLTINVVSLLRLLRQQLLKTTTASYHGETWSIVILNMNLTEKLFVGRSRWKILDICSICWENTITKDKKTGTLKAQSYSCDSSSPCEDEEPGLQVSCMDPN